MQFRSTASRSFTSEKSSNSGRWNYTLAILALLALLTVQASPRSEAFQSNCSVIYAGGNGWIIDKCATDSAINNPMEVSVDGAARGKAALVRIYHQAQGSTGMPQVAVIYASGYVRLKQNADSSPAIPFGGSFILGPAYWPNFSTYYHNPQFNQLEINTRWLPSAPLRMQARGTNGDFDVTYEMALPPARDRQTRLHVTQTYTARKNIVIDPTRRAEHQGFKLIQVSSMFINQGGTCQGGYSDCHDSNETRFIGNDLVSHQVEFSNLMLPTFVFSTTFPLGAPWLDVLHTDDQSWQGNTPNLGIALDELPSNRTITPQGWIDSTTNPNDDNASLWLNDDGPASQTWLAGQSDQMSYWLLAQDNPPEPWDDLGLRTGYTFLDFEANNDCSLVRNENQSIGGSVSSIPGYTGIARQLSYDLGAANGNWAQIRCNFNPPLDLSAYDHLRFDWRGDSRAANSLQIGLINPAAGGEENFFSRSCHHATQHEWWGQIIVPFSFLAPWTQGTTFDPHQVSAFFISVVKDPADDTGGSGTLAIDNLNVQNVLSRTVPTTFEPVHPNFTASRAAAGWLAAQQQPTGLLKSWQEETDCISHTYDQALALIVFANAKMWPVADKLIEALAAVQNLDGSWSKSHNCLTLQADGNKWEGDIAWAVYSLSRYLALGGKHPQATLIRNRAAAWLMTRVNASDGCLVIDHTEGTIDAWWAFQSAGPSYTMVAEGIKHCLLTYYWDESMGRFKGGKSWWQPYLDNQTWGGAFLKAIGEETKAGRALSYAREVLRLPSQGGQLFGFDGQAGP